MAIWGQLAGGIQTHVLCWLKHQSFRPVSFAGYKHHSGLCPLLAVNTNHLDMCPLLAINTIQACVPYWL